LIGLGLGALGSVFGASQQHKAQHNAQVQADNNLRMQQQAYDAAQGALGQRNDMLQRLILPMLGGSAFNTGQDGMMQQMRGLPDGGLIDSIRKLSSQDLGDQLSQQRGSVGSLGQRFGTAELRNEAALRERAITGLNAQYGQLGLQEQGLQQQKVLGLLSILAGGPTNAGVPAPQGQFIPQQGGGVGEVLGNIGNMALLYPWLTGQGQSGGTVASGGGFAPRLPTPPILQPGGLFNGIGISY
jgi:hypothetical protein